MSNHYTPSDPKPWLVMIYIAADDELSAISQKSQTMVGALSKSENNNDVHLVVFQDLNKGYGPFTRILEGMPGALSDITEDVVLHGKWPPNLFFGDGPGKREMDSGHFDTLKYFVSWALNRYSTQRTMLAVIGHGGGWSPTLDIPQKRSPGSTNTSYSMNGICPDYAIPP